MVAVERSKAALKFGLLSLAQGKLVRFETVPKLCNQRKALWRRQAANLIAGKQFHALRIRKNARKGNAALCATVQAYNRGMTLAEP